MNSLNVGVLLFPTANYEIFAIYIQRKSLRKKLFMKYTVRYVCKTTEN